MSKYDDSVAADHVTESIPFTYAHDLARVKGHSRMVDSARMKHIKLQNGTDIRC